MSVQGTTVTAEPEGRTVGKRKRVDLPGAMAITDAAAHFDWTWDTADAARFAERVGWEAPVTVRPGNGLSIDAGPDRPNAAAALVDPDNDRLEWLLVDLSQYGKHPDRSALLDTFDELNALLRTSFGPPAGSATGAIHWYWILPAVTVSLSFATGALLLHLEPPVTHAPAGRSSILRQPTAEPNDETAFLDAIPSLIEADPGDWLREDAVRIVGATGWPVDAATPKFRWGIPNVRIAVAECPSAELSLIAERTPGARSGHWISFGGFDRVVLTLQPVTGVNTATYLAALTECVRLLGVPTLVGGPDAWASWRRPTVTVTLSRPSDLTYSWLRLELRPTEPGAVQRHWDVERYPEYTDTDYERPDNWASDRSWLISPDELDDRLAAAIAEAILPPPKAHSWAELDNLLYPLFESLAADLPVLQPFANTVVWMISRRKDPDSRIVQGWFGPAGCGVEVLDADGEWQVTEYEPTAAAGARIAHATHTALRASGVKRPGKLRCEAWSLLAPQELRTFETGLVRGK